jgi:CRISPR-associated protein Cmr3
MTAPAAPQACWVALTPRDTMLVRDGRAFDAGTDVAGHAVGGPQPSTVAGAVGRAFAGEPAAVRGPVVGVDDGLGGWSLRFPTPADVVRRPEGGLARLRLGAPGDTVVTDLAGRDGPPRLLVGDGSPAGGWVDEVVLERYLRAEQPLGPGEVVPEGDPVVGEAPAPWAAELRLGLARSRHRTAAAGFLYQAEHLRPADGVVLLAELERPPAAAPVQPTVPLGGERRLVEVSVVDPVHLPDPPPLDSGRVAVYFATAAFFPRGWRWCPQKASLVAAAVTGPQPVATATPGEGFWRSRTLRWAVPAGSVYYLDFGTPADAQEWVAGNHGRCVAGQATDDQGRDRLRTAGFGLVLAGRWDA